MYPVLFRIGTFEITSFGVLVAAGALIGLWLLRVELKWAGLPESAADAGIAGIAGGLVGAKLLWVVEHIGDEPVLDLLLSRGGLSWFGGLAGGLAGLWLIRRRRLPFLAVLSAATPGLAVGHHRSHRLPPGWRRLRTPVRPPMGDGGSEGLPPPTCRCIRRSSTKPRRSCRSQSSATMAAPGMERPIDLQGVLMLVGAARFVVELWRINEPVLGPLTVADSPRWPRSPRA
jgi:hypothetical protein